MKKNMNDHHNKSNQASLKKEKLSDNSINKKDDLNKPLLIVSSIIPPIGFFLFFKHRKKSPNKSKKAMGSAIIGIPIGYLMGEYVMPHLINLMF